MGLASCTAGWYDVFMREYDLSNRRVRNVIARITLALPWKPLCLGCAEGDFVCLFSAAPFLCTKCHKLVDDGMFADRMIVLSPRWPEEIYEAEKRFKQEYRRIRRSGG